MADIALEEKINKIRLQNEEIRRRHEEVEEDKKKAAEQNALVQMVPSTDWPERKEPPEFSNPPPRNIQKQKVSAKEHNESLQQYHVGGRKGHTFAQGDGPPPDPKYNFLADSDREESHSDNPKENAVTKNRNRPSRGNLRKRGGARDGSHKDNRTHPTSHRDEYPPEYDAWRAERNRIDEDRISRQRTAEGNWRREWDNNKVADDVTKRELRATFGDTLKRDKHFESRHHSDGQEHINYNRGANQRSRGSQKSFYGNHDYRYNNSYDEHGRAAQTSGKNAIHINTTEERTVMASDKNIQVTLNQSLTGAKGQVTSIKVSPPNIAGTGRVGPRQKSRVTYSSHSDFETSPRDPNPVVRQKLSDDKLKGSYFTSSPKNLNNRKSSTLKKKENTSKSPYSQRRELKMEQSEDQKEPQKSSQSQEDSNAPSTISTQMKSKEATDESRRDVIDDLLITETDKIFSQPINSTDSKKHNTDTQIEESNTYSDSNNADENQIITEVDSDGLLQKVMLDHAVAKTEDVMHDTEADNSAVTLEENKLDVSVVAASSINVDVDVTAGIQSLEVKVADNSTKDDKEDEKRDIEIDSLSKSDDTIVMSTYEPPSAAVPAEETNNQLSNIRDVKINEHVISSDSNEMQRFDNLHNCADVKQNIMNDNSNESKEDTLCDEKVPDEKVESKTAQCSGISPVNEDVDNILEMIVNDVSCHDTPKKNTEAEECQKHDILNETCANVQMNDNDNTARIDKI